MPRLTLGDCLAQPNGTIGRLFETPDARDDLPAWKSFRLLVQDAPFTGPYRVINVAGDKMEIEGYVLGGTRRKVVDVLVSDRSRDLVLDSDFSLYCYTVTGRAGSNPRTAHLVTG